MNWTRVCQECGKENQRQPPPPKSNRKFTMWARVMKCQYCKSPALNYGYDKEAVPPTVDEEDDEA